MDEQLVAYNAGRADGLAGVKNEDAALHAETGHDYRAGLHDGQVEIFESELIAAIRKAMGGKLPHEKSD